MKLSSNSSSLIFTQDYGVDLSVLQVVAKSLMSLDAPYSRRELGGDEMPSEIQYVGVLIKSVFSDCELLKHVYLKLACLIGCVCAPSLCVGEPLWKCACLYRRHYVCKQELCRVHVAYHKPQQCSLTVFLSGFLFGCPLYNFNELRDLDDLGV